LSLPLDKEVKELQELLSVRTKSILDDIPSPILEPKLSQYISKPTLLP